MIQLLGFIFISVLGIISHFLYEWSNHNKYFAIFFAVNESTWEHIKIAVGPSLLWILIEIIFNYSNPNFLFAKVISLLTIILLIPLLHYLYLLILKKHNFIFSIFNFLFSIGLGQYLSYLILKYGNTSNITNYLSLLIIVIIAICYLTLTCTPLRNILFKDPITNKYGINAHRKQIQKVSK